MSKPINVSDLLDADILARYSEIGTDRTTQAMLLSAQVLRRQATILKHVEAASLVIVPAAPELKGPS